MKKVDGKLLVQQDLQELMRRLNSRMEEALRIFAQKRSREHFEQMFFNRYKHFSISVIEEIGSQVYPFVVSIYEEVDQLQWYLLSTEDMPSMVKTKVDGYLKNMNKNYATVLDQLISFDSLDIDKKVLDDNILVDDHTEYNDDKDSDLFGPTDSKETPPPFHEEESEES
jgi:hypothetical protein